MRVSLRQTGCKSQPHQRFLSKGKTLEIRLPGTMAPRILFKSTRFRKAALDAGPTEMA
jgi:hypothetical protein